jgi:hypothetical protein
MKIHQGTHSPDAFSMNLHELVYFVQCDDGTKIAATTMVAFGKPGEFGARFGTVVVGTMHPVNYPSGGGGREISDRRNVEATIFKPAGQWSDFSLGFYEDWISANYFRTADGRQIAYYDPHFAVFNPSRYYYPGAPNSVGYAVDTCYEEPSPGLRARGGSCDLVKDIYPAVKRDDPRSPFRGDRREFYFNQTWLGNAGGPQHWYTDPFGGNASPTRFPGSIQQFVAPINNERGFWLESQAFGKERNYGGNGVHAPN